MSNERDPGDEQPGFWMVFDVESIGLHGPAFAVGWVVIDRVGMEHEAGELYTPPAPIRAATDDHAWIAANVTHSECAVQCDSAEDVRSRFWERFAHWREHGAVLCAEVPWPVEASFLSDCINDSYFDRKWAGPYPLIDVASVRYAAGLDPLATEPRLPGEMPAHNALADARQSARLLMEALS